MRALALASFDVAPEVMEVPDPVAGPGEVLVRVHAASINAFDIAVASGMAKAFMSYEFPAVIGQDLAGTVEAIGEGVEWFAIGDRVFGSMGSKGKIRDGSFAELTTPKADAIALSPTGLSDTDAASLAVAGTTAWSAVNAVKPKKGDLVLILGATGGLGSFAIQLAAARGAHVIASARPGDEEFVTSLGAAETVDYTADVAAAIRSSYPKGVDALIDAVTQDADTFATLAGLVRAGGRATSTRGTAGKETQLGEVSVYNSNASPDYLAPLADLVVQGSVRVAVKRTYPLADAARAIGEFTTEHTVGKLVISMA